VKPEKSAADLVTNLAARGRYHFTTEEAAKALGGSIVATRAALRRLKRKGAIAVPYRGFHVIVPPEYLRIGCLPADQFIPQLMAHLELNFYAALLSAAQYHGAAHQQPQLFQVMVRKNRPPIECGEVRVAFVGRRNVDEIPVVEHNTPRGSIRVSTPEATAFDLVGYPEHAGGIDHVATVLAELGERLSAERLVALALLSPVAWSQRLGHILERVGESDRAAELAAYVRHAARETVPLDSRRPDVEAERDPRWKLAVNVKLVPDL
jgi:predicted transcriptional regulator of viral defense system